MIKKLKKIETFFWKQCTIAPDQLLKLKKKEKNVTIQKNLKKIKKQKQKQSTTPPDD